MAPANNTIRFMRVSPPDPIRHCAGSLRCWTVERRCGLPGVTPDVSGGHRTTICRSTAAEKLRPLLLADTVTAFVPRGHVIVVPGLVPQPPVHVSVVIGH